MNQVNLSPKRSSSFSKIVQLKKNENSRSPSLFGKTWFKLVRKIRKIKKHVYNNDDQTQTLNKIFKIKKFFAEKTLQKCKRKFLNFPWKRLTVWIFSLIVRKSLNSRTSRTGYLTSQEKSVIFYCFFLIFNFFPQKAARCTHFFVWLENVIFLLVIHVFW